jgi:hypothetical protein
MAGPYADEDEEKPLDPAVERAAQAGALHAGINLGLLFIALMAVVGRLSTSRATAARKHRPPPA